MINVLHKRAGIAGIYIGRPSPLGNPFAIGRDGTRNEVIAKYRTWLVAEIHDNPAGRTAQELRKLINEHETNRLLNLVCWCAPLACHGDVIKQAIIHKSV